MSTNQRSTPREGYRVPTGSLRQRAELATGDGAAPVSGALGPGALDDFEPRERSEFASRVFNLLCALVMLVLLSPIMMVAALLVAITSRGPVLYTQTRVGIDRRWSRTRALHERRREDLGGIPFTIYKFRSMRVDAEINGQAVWAKKDDDRVTGVGRFMRKSRIDELPQLFNVFRGDMNIVGPRPERPSIFVRLREQIDEYPVRQRVKPGITGLAQICNPYDTSLDDVRRKVAFDIRYMRSQSLFEDIRIMARTIPVMIFRIGGW
ncbi:MAG: sugar transferase [Gemmatimonadaceae bacterium]|nr:sugar transferase [Gemmatimonadaceae bacterium]